MSKTPKEIWCESGLYYDYKTDWSEGSWSRSNDGGVKYIRADLVKEQSDEVQAAVAAALREAAADVSAVSMDGDYLAERILALITPDAQAALDRYVKERSDELVAAERERGFWLGRSCGGSKAEIDAALAAIRKGVKND